MALQSKVAYDGRRKCWLPAPAVIVDLSALTALRRYFVLCARTQPKNRTFSCRRRRRGRRQRRWRRRRRRFAAFLFLLSAIFQSTCGCPHK